MNPRFPGGFGYPELIGGEIINTETDMVDVVDDDKDDLYILYFTGNYIDYDTKHICSTSELKTKTSNNIINLMVRVCNSSAYFKSISSGCYPGAPIYIIDENNYSLVFADPSYKSEYAMFTLSNAEKHLVQPDAEYGFVDKFVRNDTKNKYYRIAVNNDTVFAIRQDRTLWYQTDLKKGEYFTEDSLTQLSSEKFSKICLSRDTFIALDIHGYIYTNGIGVKNYKNNSFDKLYKVDDNKYIDIAVGESCAYAINNDGELFSVGLNSSGELGLGHYNNVSKFTKVSCSLKLKKCEANNKRIMCLSEEGYVLGCGRIYLGATAHPISHTGTNGGIYYDKVKWYEDDEYSEEDAYKYEYLSSAVIIDKQENTTCNLLRCSTRTENIHACYTNIFLGKWSTYAFTSSAKLRSSGLYHIIRSPITGNINQSTYAGFVDYILSESVDTYSNITPEKILLSSNHNIDFFKNLTELEDVIDSTTYNELLTEEKTKLINPYMPIYHHYVFEHLYDFINDDIDDKIIDFIEDMRILCNGHAMLLLVKYQTNNVKKKTKNKGNNTISICNYGTTIADN